MSAFRVRFAVAGGHVHCRLFSAKATNMAYAKCGDFTVCKGEEFTALLAAFDGAEFIGDDPGVGNRATATGGGESVSDARDDRLGELTKDEWLLVARRLRPDLTDAEYDQMWADFIAAKERKALS